MREADEPQRSPLFAVQEAHAQRGAGELLQQLDDVGAAREQPREEFSDPRDSRCRRVISGAELTA